jgi:hypothetical protein
MRKRVRWGKLEKEHDLMDLKKLGRGRAVLRTDVARVVASFELL